jgi:hypothetical protein
VTIQDRRMWLQLTEQTNIDMYCSNKEEETNVLLTNPRTTHGALKSSAILMADSKMCLTVLG